MLFIAEQRYYQSQYSEYSCTGDHISKDVFFDLLLCPPDLLHIIETAYTRIKILKLKMSSAVRTPFSKLPYRGDVLPAYPLSEIYG